MLHINLLILLKGCVFRPVLLLGQPLLCGWCPEVLGKMFRPCVMFNLRNIDHSVSIQICPAFVFGQYILRETHFFHLCGGLEGVHKRK